MDCKRSRWTMIVASLMGLTFVLYAQVTLPPGSVSTIPGDRSPYLGRPIINPETLSGFWETPNGHGGAVGIHLLLMTTVPTDGWEKPSDAPQSWQLLELGVYERRGATIQLEESNNFSDSPRGGNVGFEAGHLSLHWISPPTASPSMSILFSSLAIDGLAVCTVGALTRTSS
jgi:hypothetical protein